MASPHSGILLSNQLKELPSLPLYVSVEDCRFGFQYLETLAAAYAHAGDFQHAVEWEQRAIASEISPKQVMRERLQLYRAGKVWTQN